jgi:hypothetical protein
MNSSQTSAYEADTDSATENNQAAVEKTYSQSEVNDMMARMKSTVAKKALKPYEDLGDPEELRSIKNSYQQKQKEDQMKRGEWESILQDQAAKSAAEILKRENVIREFKVEQPLVSLAAQYRSVNPEQVKTLLKGNLRLNEDGEVEVFDTKGKTRYDDDGTPLSVDKYVKEFLDANPHFVGATPATTHTNSNVSSGVPSSVKLEDLDLTRQDHRKVYAEARKAGRY